MSEIVVSGYFWNKIDYPIFRGDSSRKCNPMEANCLLNFRVGKILHSPNVRAILLVIHKFTNGFALNLQNLLYPMIQQVLEAICLQWPSYHASTFCYVSTVYPTQVVRMVTLRVTPASLKTESTVRTSSVLRNFSSSNYHEIPALL